MTPLQCVSAAAQALKVFPLPSAVLFPNTALPLHIFEPRYREMVKDCLEGDRVIALAQMETGWESNYQGRPRLLPIACAGILAWHESLPEGRFNIVLHGITRVRVLEELPPTKAYREVRAQVLTDPPVEASLDALVRRAVLELFARAPEAASSPLIDQSAHHTGGALADVVAAAVVGDTDRRYQLLCQLDPKTRLREVLGELGDVIARLGPAKASGPLN